VGIYTGILLGAVPARPFWNTPMTAQLFLFSAMSTGAASLLLISALLPRRFAPADPEGERRFVTSLDVVLILLEIFMIIPFILHHALSTWSSASSISLIIGGPFTVPFWIGFLGLGIALPLLMEVLELYPVVLRDAVHRYGRVISVASGGLVLTGGFLLRYIFVYAGQVSHFLGV
jgi:formate-dependent nitrite reductase membrane component NrfD